MKRVFFLTYYFPPLGGVASMRANKMAKYLLDFGWQATVFHAGRGTYSLQDPSLVAEIPAEITAIPVRTWEGASLIQSMNRMHLGAITYRMLRLFPIDGQLGWIPGLLKAVRNEIDRHGKPDSIYSSSSPYSAHVAALRIHREFDLPWVADFRDEWTLNPGLHFATPWHAKLAAKLEAEVLRESAVVTTVTESFAEQFQRGRPVDKPPVIVIPNGFDEADFPETAVSEIKDKWTLAIVGSVYHSTDPVVLLDELTVLLENGTIDPNFVRVVHVGNGQLKLKDGFPAENLRIGFVTHAQAIEWMRRAHALMMALNPHHAAAASARIYEYIRSGTPVIAVVPKDGEAFRLLLESGAGRPFSQDDRHAIRDELVRHFQSWKQGKALKGASGEKAQKYSRREGARQLAELLSSVAG